MNRLSKRWLGPGAMFALCISAACPCWGKELVYLTSGFQIEAQSHTEENQVLVFQTMTGTLELPVAAVARIEPVQEHSLRADILAKNPDEAPEKVLKDAAVAQGLPPELIRSVAHVESRLDSHAVSPKGAIGLMQLMPGTAAELGVNPDHASENAQGGARYLRDLLIRYKGDAVLALAAYNAGPGAVGKFRGVPPYSETQRYVKRVLREYAHEQKLQATRSLVSGAGPSKPSATN